MVRRSLLPRATTLSASCSSWATASASRSFPSARPAGWQEIAQPTVRYGMDGRHDKYWCALWPVRSSRLRPSIFAVSSRTQDRRTRTGFRRLQASSLTWTGRPGTAREPCAATALTCVQPCAWAVVASFDVVALWARTRRRYERMRQHAGSSAEPPVTSVHALVTLHVFDQISVEQDSASV